MRAVVSGQALLGCLRIHHLRDPHQIFDNGTGRYCHVRMLAAGLEGRVCQEALCAGPQMQEICHEGPLQSQCAFVTCISLSQGSSSLINFSHVCHSMVID